MDGFLVSSASLDEGLRAEYCQNLERSLVEASGVDSYNHRLRIYWPGFASPSQEHFFLLLAGQVVGCLEVLKQDTESEKFLRIFVAPDFRRRGLASKALTLAKAFTGSAHIIGECADQSIAGREFLLTQGWRISPLPEGQCDEHLCLKRGDLRLPPLIEIVQLAVPDDMGGLLTLWEGEMETLEAWRKGVECIALVRDGTDGKIVGSISWVDDFIMNLLVAESHRCRGYGSALSAFAAQQCLLTHPFASIETWNPAASRLYRHLGFKIAASYREWEKPEG